jgi:hypothetical protein
MSVNGINLAQRIALNTYAEGDFAHLELECEDSASKLAEKAAQVGDTLFEFIIKELASSEDCENIEEAVRRIAGAENQLFDLRTRLEKRCIVGTPD